MCWLSTGIRRGQYAQIGSISWHWHGPLYHQAGVQSLLVPHTLLLLAIKFDFRSD